ncbi:hypothetical protein PAGU2595_008060 [Lysobacter xanthus]
MRHSSTPRATDAPSTIGRSRGAGAAAQPASSVAVITITNVLVIPSISGGARVDPRRAGAIGKRHAVDTAAYRA